ncbi:Secondary metabolism regulator LAE1 [Colletotrichum aenigma]|uniref:Secondary metabolism regulator LAE1 n=1 Tax=Colletotrichum aenigma TaxID=1215731 RepID=UPI0018729EE7|nr:Secondary metabolism regulator LAE1 [Colletotrichum aenigma]KAF5512179.1 Secondary metabolism regulator LAE1 [Colletotrichum aenigma]
MASAFIELATGPSRTEPAIPSPPASIPSPPADPQPSRTGPSVRDPAADPQPGVAADTRIEPNPDLDGGDDNDDADSAIDAQSIVSSTASLSESIFDYRKLHGRTYQNSKTTEYWAPNDEQQNDGLDMIHNALLMILDDELFLAPIGDNPQRVLDVGTGTGIWAIDFADQYPDAEVLGTDISPIQPTWVPTNLRFVMDDCLLDWMWPENHFDFVHLRCLYGSIPDWVSLYRSAFRHLKPGGWVQNLEFDVNIQSDHVQLPPDHIFHEWRQIFDQGGEKMGRSFSISRGHTMKHNMEAAGFVDVVERKIKTPMHGWPKDEKLQHAGLLINMAFDQSLEGFATFLMTEILGWDPIQATVLGAQMRREMKKKSNYAWCETTIVYGRKPAIF